ncbi:MAG: prepilin-type N-terminal cleavage/methylation domain-containing protein [Candidatus Tantalella remota]|nr:prepilin-type N-terminal cleavage/methylation domain-containing protein [Candidatus Tantalella remota]
MKIRKMLGKKGFTLVEIMIVVAIIGLLAAIAIPNFMKARERAQTNACIANLKQFDGAKSLLALDDSMSTGEDIEMSDLVTSYIKRTPVCPAGGTYTIGAVGTTPTCDVANHVLP